MLRISSFISLVLLIATSARAGVVTLGWDANVESDVAGYVISYGTSSHNYTMTADVGNSTTFQFSEAQPGTTYYFAVRAYNVSGVQSDYSDEVAYTQLSSISITSLTADKPSPQPPGATIALSTSAFGGFAPYQFKWIVARGSTAQVVQDWSTAGSILWTPELPDSYSVTVMARSNGETSEDGFTARTIPYTIAGSALALASLQTDVPSPQAIDTPVTFRAVASGGSGAYEFKWFLGGDGDWRTVRDWSSSGQWTWSSNVPGNYLVGVWARTAGNSADAPENQSSAGTISFQVADSFLRVTDLTASEPAPQPAGSAILFTASSVGGVSPEYRWWVFEGGEWIIKQDWSPNPRFLWTPSRPSSRYEVQVRVRDLSTDALMIESMATKKMAYPITGGGRGDGTRGNSKR